MAFERYVRTGPSGRNPVQPGESSIEKCGNLLFSAVDANTVGLKEEVAVMLDRATRRIALKVHTDEDGFAFHACTRTAKKAPSSTWRINVKGVLKQLGFKDGEVRGRFAVTVKPDAGLLIVNLGSKVEPKKKS